LQYKDQMKELAYLNKFFYKYRWRLLPGILFVIISNLFAVLPAQVIRIAFDLVNENIAIFRLFDGFDRQELISKGFWPKFIAIWSNCPAIGPAQRNIFVFYASDHHSDVKTY
jgi:ATP-binding cassette subfamily B multidrug efflux pump